jgi:hypothetical protein
MPAQNKPPGQRRRRNAGQSQWQELPAEGRKGEIPKPWTGRQLGDVATRYWETLWSSPMAVTFIDADIQPLTRLAVLVDDRDRSESGAGLIEIVEGNYAGEVEVVVGKFAGDAEIRQLEDRYGVSPKARRALQWEIKAGEVLQHPTAGRTSGSRRVRAVESA